MGALGLSRPNPECLALWWRYDAHLACKSFPPVSNNATILTSLNVLKAIVNLNEKQFLEQ